MSNCLLLGISARRLYFCCVLITPAAAMATLSDDERCHHAARGASLGVDAEDRAAAWRPSRACAVGAQLQVAICDVHAPVAKLDNQLLQQLLVVLPPPPGKAMRERRLAYVVAALMRLSVTKGRSKFRNRDGFQQWERLPAMHASSGLVCVRLFSIF